MPPPLKRETPFLITLSIKALHLQEIFTPLLSARIPDPSRLDQPAEEISTNIFFAWNRFEAKSERLQL